MTTRAGYRSEASGTHPPYEHRAYVSTHKRAPRHEPIRIEHTLSEITGPRFSAANFGPGDSDLTHFAGGEALGERIV
ncbi:MAG TPA: protocatechuate 3,4-dioxygenase subunit beta, partial [Methylomirabilota bacterium]|nr:protocatechuate 3,4-dioxygenase subunit beta [Methylomirabilota bacterium]